MINPHPASGYRRPKANSYQQWHPTPETDSAAKVLVISPDGQECSATIAQDAEVYRLRLAAGESVSHTLRDGRGLWLQVISGQLSTAGATLSPGDALSTEEAGDLTITATEPAEALLFDLL